MFSVFVKSMLAGQPFQPMFNADPGGGGGGGNPDPNNPGNPDPNKPGTPDPNNPGNPDPNNPGDPDKVTFDEKQQAEIQKIINATVAKERKKAEEAATAAAAEAERKAKLSAEEKAEEERKDRERAAQEKETKANQRIINLEIKDVARELGVAAKKLDRFMKIVDRDDLEVDTDGNVDRSKVEAAVKALLADMPEFKGTTNNPGPGGNFNNGGGADGAKYSMEQIKTMSAQEIAKDYDEIMKSMAIHQKAQ